MTFFRLLIQCTPTQTQGMQVFGRPMHAIYSLACVYICETPELPRTIGELLRQASGKGEPLKDYIASLINDRAEADKPLSPSCVDALSRFIGNSDNTLAGILSSFNAPLMISQTLK